MTRSRYPLVGGYVETDRVYRRRIVQRRSRLRRGFLIFVGLLLVLQGAFELNRGHFFYPNYFGGPVFAWFAIVVGSVILAFALMIPSRLMKAWSEKRNVVVPGQETKRS